VEQERRVKNAVKSRFSGLTYDVKKRELCFQVEETPFLENATDMKGSIGFQDKNENQAKMGKFFQDHNEEGTQG